MTAMDPTTGKMVTITISEPGQVVDARERFLLKRLADESRRNSDRIIAEAQALVRKTYPQSDSGDETSHDGC